MRSLNSCWRYLQSAQDNCVIVSLGGGAYEIYPTGRGGPGDRFMEESPARVVGVYAPGADLQSIEEDAAELKRCA